MHACASRSGVNPATSPIATPDHHLHHPHLGGGGWSATCGGAAGGSRIQTLPLSLSGWLEATTKSPRKQAHASAAESQVKNLDSHIS